MKYFAAKSRHLRLGRRGEKLAAKLLKAKDYSILCRNYKVKSGEIDLIARDGDTLVFIEVKSRRARPGRAVDLRPAENLSAKQRERIYRASQSYLSDIDNPSVIYRFDLIEVVLSRFKIHAIRHWENNFTKPVRYS